MKIKVDLSGEDMFCLELDLQNYVVFVICWPHDVKMLLLCQCTTWDLQNAPGYKITHKTLNDSLIVHLFKQQKGKFTKQHFTKWQK